MFIEVSKTMYIFIRGTIRIQWNSWYNYLYSAKYSQPLFRTALINTYVNGLNQILLKFSAWLDYVTRKNGKCMTMIKSD